MNKEEIEKILAGHVYAERVISGIIDDLQIRRNQQIDSIREWKDRLASP